MDIVADFHLLAQALDYFEKEAGYTRVELPWHVPDYAVRMTNPNIDNMAMMSGGYLVASGEQSFLLCDIKGRLPPGRYCGLTPCFRPGDDQQPYHQETFYKVELYRTDVVDRYAVDEMLLEVSEFSRRILRNEEFSLEVVNTPEQDGFYEEILLTQEHSCDINLNGIEIGSYGLRRVGDYHWAYGTGIAEPRFSQARSLKCSN